jgi:hypothetical protein
MHSVLAAGVALLAATSLPSPFNSYEVFLAPRTMAGACSPGDPEQFRNRTYSFRGNRPPHAPLKLRDGRAIERNMFGTIEWESALVTADPFAVAGRPAVLLVVGVNHVHGSGGASHVIVAECRARRLVVLFEAGGEGIQDASFSPSGQLTVTRWIWAADDAHCCPGKQADERYVWGRAGRFVAAGRIERAAPK